MSFETNTSCQVREWIFIRGLQYLYFIYCYPLKTVENDDSCPARKIPPYLISEQSQCLLSVSYNWGGFDSIDLYNEKLQRMKAGNVNTAISPLLNCTTGVDCSGFVSNLWGLNSKWGTAQIFNNTFSIDINMMQIGDVFVKPNYHVMLYTGNTNGEISTMESVARPGKVIVSMHPMKWFLQHGYTPKMAYNVCPEQ